MKKRLKLRKVTLRDLDERTLGAAQGGDTFGPLCSDMSCAADTCSPGCNGVSDDTNCTASFTNCDTASCDSCGDTCADCTDWLCFTWEPTCC